MDPHGHVSGLRRRASSVGSRSADHLGAIGEDPEEDDGRDSDTETIASQNTEHNREPGFPSRPYWLDDEGLKKGEVENLSMQEEQFWKELLEKYLYPIDEDKAEKVRAWWNKRVDSIFLRLFLNADDRVCEWLIIHQF